LGSTQRYVQRNAEVLSSQQALGDDLGQVGQEIHAAALEGRWARAQSLRNTDLTSLQRRQNDTLDQLSAKTHNDVTDQVEESADAQNRNRVFWTITAVASVIIGVVAGFLTVTSITRPIRGLMQAAAAIRAGDLSRRARIESSDEIGELAEVFNSMTERLRSSIENLEDRVSARTRDLQIAADVSRQVTTVLDIEQLLQQVVALTAKNYGLYACSVYLPSEDGRELFQAAGADFVGQPLDVPELRRIPYDADPSVIALAARTRKPVTVNDVGESKEYLSLSAL